MQQGGHRVVVRAGGEGGLVDRSRNGTSASSPSSVCAFLRLYAAAGVRPLTHLIYEREPPPPSSCGHGVRPATKVEQTQSSLGELRHTKPVRFVQVVRHLDVFADPLGCRHLVLGAHVEHELSILNLRLSVHVVDGETMREVEKVQMPPQDLNEAIYTACGRSHVRYVECTMRDGDAWYDARVIPYKLSGADCLHREHEAQSLTQGATLLKVEPTQWDPPDTRCSFHRRVPLLQVIVASFDELEDALMRFLKSATNELSTSLVPQDYTSSTVVEERVDLKNRVRMTRVRGAREAVGEGGEVWM